MNRSAGVFFVIHDVIAAVLRCEVYTRVLCKRLDERLGSV
jgi:hypothetical protein